MADFTQIINKINADINTNGVGAITGAKLNAVLRDMIAAIDEEKQDTLTIDATPTEDSTNPVQSGGMYVILSTMFADGCLYGGIVRPQDSPTFGDDHRYFYIATTNGRYVNFNNYEVDRYVVVFLWNENTQNWGYVSLCPNGQAFDDLIENKADKVGGATSGNLAGLDSDGNLNDSGIAASDVATTSDLAGKQDTISDLATIRSGAASGATAYQKPSSGIPQSDLSSDVQSQLNKHFKGWFASVGYLETEYPSPVVGDYAYVKGAESTDPAAIYECTTNGSWSDSGRTADTSNVQTFASGEEVNEVHIQQTKGTSVTNLMSQKAVTDEIDDIMGIHYIGEKTYSAAASNVYFDNLGLQVGDTVIVKTSGTAKFSTAWFYGDAGTAFGNKIVNAEQNDTQEISIATATDKFGLRVYTFTSSGTVKIDLIIKKGAIDLINDKLDCLELQGYQKLTMVADVSGYTVSFLPGSEGYKAVPQAGNSLYYLYVNTGDKLIIRNISSSINSAYISYTPATPGYLYLPQIISTTNSVQNKIEWTAPFSGTIIISAIDASPITVYKFSNNYVSDISASANSSLWKGKTIVCFGDSLTEKKGNDGYGYPDWMNALKECNCINVGIGGTQLRQRTTPVLSPTSNDEAYAGLDIVNMIKAACGVEFDETHTYGDVATNAAQYLSGTDDNTAIVARLLAIDWTKVDAVCVFGGTNDWKNGPSDIGSSGSTDVNKTLGAINTIIQLLLSTYKQIKLYWFTPTVRWIDYASGTGLASNWSDVYVSNGRTLKEFSAAIMSEVELSHIPICDLYNTLGWNQYNFSNYFGDNDGTHPKDYNMLAKKMMNFIGIL